MLLTLLANTCKRRPARGAAVSLQAAVIQGGYWLKGAGGGRSLTQCCTISVLVSRYFPGGARESSRSRFQKRPPAGPGASRAGPGAGWSRAGPSLGAEPSRPRGAALTHRGVCSLLVRVARSRFGSPKASLARAGGLMKPELPFSPGMFSRDRTTEKLRQVFTPQLSSTKCKGCPGKRHTSGSRAWNFLLGSPRLAPLPSPRHTPLPSPGYSHAVGKGNSVLGPVHLPSTL